MCCRATFMDYLYNAQIMMTAVDIVCTLNISQYYTSFILIAEEIAPDNNYISDAGISFVFIL